VREKQAESEERDRRSALAMYEKWAEKEEQERRRARLVHEECAATEQRERREAHWRETRWREALLKAVEKVRVLPVLIPALTFSTRSDASIEGRPTHTKEREKPEAEGSLWYRKHETVVW
jgi:hypothetical protein